MAVDVRVFARQAGRPVTRALVEERLSEWRGERGRGTVKGRAAQLASVQTTLRTALRWEG